MRVSVWFDLYKGNTVIYDVKQSLFYYDFSIILEDSSVLGLWM